MNVLKKIMLVLRKHGTAFIVGAPFVAAFFWGGAYLLWSLAPKELAPARPPWFHDPVTFTGLAIGGGVLEAFMLAVLAGLVVAAVRLGQCMLTWCSDRVT